MPTFLAIAYATTWLLAMPTALAWMRHEVPPPYALACAGLSAFGPSFAALVVGRRKDVSYRWRTSPLWVAIALATPAAIHLVATALAFAIGHRAVTWFHPPLTFEHVAALVVFPLGEELGWRGFAHPRLVARHGLVKGSLLLGTAWGVWHLAYAITPEAAGFDAFVFGLTMIELPLYALVLAWLFERAGRSMAVALAFHAGAHLDHLERTPKTEVTVHALHLAVVAVVALAAARALAKMRPR
jgi:membrane protease YdiL (CAAX protease family)